jgi:hypothetical protein
VLALLVLTAVVGLHGVLTHEGGLDAARHGSGANEPRRVVEQLGCFGTVQKNDFLQEQQPALKDVGLVALATVRINGDLRAARPGVLSKLVSRGIVA